MAAAVALQDDVATVAVGPHVAGTDEVSDRRMPGVDLVEAQLDEAHPGVLRRRVGQQRAHSRPRAVRADDEIGGDRALPLEKVTSCEWLLARTATALWPQRMAAG
ncbi:hypothetical protein [Streptomyces montanus]|uniref:hypothetical protein n=1 Tax=Streptomyces montanus TaxID=2580423 RepID=UPI001BB10D20|nr:hypothetical protein [Streptomyces montanus]